jgi:hypothetical protein
MSKKFKPISELLMRRQVPSFEWLTDEEVQAALRLHQQVPSHEFAKRVEAEVIAPVIDRINAHFGQEMHAPYLAYMLQNEFMKGDRAAEQYRRW